MRTVTHDGGDRLIIRFPYNAKLVQRVKGLPERRFSGGGDDKHWWVPACHAQQVVALLTAEGFRFCEATLNAAGEDAGLAGVGAQEPAGPGVLQASAQPPGADAPNATAGPGAAARGAATRGTGKRSAPARRNSTAAIEDASDAPLEHLTISDLNRLANAALARAFPENVWLVGEISDYNKRRDRSVVGFELLERAANGNKQASVSATLFARPRAQIESRLRQAGDPFKLEDGLKVRLRARIEIYPAWGQYRAVIDDVDVHYTLGEAARRREEILRLLGAEGLTERNTRLPIPPAPLRLGLITSLDSDAYNDVLQTLRDSGFAFQVTAHGARVQGPNTEASVLNALDALRARSSDLDAVLICRGGGSRVDLGWFDSEALGRAVATFPLPVVVGIGHEQDRSVLDGVARKQRTPTAAAQYMVALVAEFMEGVQRRVNDILEQASQLVQTSRRDLARHASEVSGRSSLQLRHARARIEDRLAQVLRGAGLELNRERTELSRRCTFIAPASRRLLSQHVRQLDGLAGNMTGLARRRTLEQRRLLQDLARDIAREAPRSLGKAHTELSHREKNLHLLDPARVLERGYALLQLQRGDGPGATPRAVKRPEDAPEGTVLTARIAQGQLSLRSLGATGGDHAPAATPPSKTASPCTSQASNTGAGEASGQRTQARTPGDEKRS